MGPLQSERVPHAVAGGKVYVNTIRVLVADAHCCVREGVKAILNVTGEAGPIAVHGVQHLFHPPARLQAWPDADRRSKLVFITRDLERKVLEESLASYRDQAKRAANAAAPN